MKFSRQLAVITFLFSFVATLHPATLYVNATNVNPTSPYTDWAAAATNIQDAIDVANEGDLILVTNGLYATGGRSMDGLSTNRVTLDKAVTVQSVNGALVTVIQGFTPFATGPTSVRCAWLTNGAVLTGFTLQNGAARQGTAGGGAFCTSNAVIANCIIASNTTLTTAGGVYRGTVENCLIIGNTGGTGEGGGAYNCQLKNCTIVGNSWPQVNQISTSFAATNCIIALGQPGGNYSGGSYSYCCTSPLPTGVGNFTNLPQLFADNVHLLPNSPCIAAGTNIGFGSDLLGAPWGNPPSIGCAEWTPAPLALAPQFTFRGPSAGFTVGGSALDGTAPLTFSWIKDGVLLREGALYSGTLSTNLTVASADLTNGGSYQLIVSNAFGIATSAPAVLNIHCADASSTNAIAPYADWNTAAATIQDAIEAANPGDLVLVTNGLYATSGKSIDGVLTNRVMLDKAITVMSVNGPFATIIQGVPTNGTSAVRCAWLTNDASLIGFTLCYGATRTSGSVLTDQTGGGVWCDSNTSVVANCAFISNSAGYAGGGAYQGTIRNSFFLRNTAVNSGGGAASLASLFNCTLVTNFSAVVNPGSVTNCIFSSAVVFGPSTRAGYCCGVASSGIGNFNLPPLLAADNLHLETGSPCIGAGTNLAVGVDIFGRPWNNPPSIGCVEASPTPAVTAPTLQFVFSPLGFTVGHVTFQGIGPLTVWWLKDGVPLQDNSHFTGSQTANLAADGLAFSDGGNYQLVVSNNYGVVTSAVVSLNVHCVDAAGTNAVAPYTSWANAATNIQDAIDAAAPGEVVLVTNGVYTGGGKSADGVITNRVTLDKSIIVQSVNGPFVTAIQGAYDPAATNGPLAVRGAWMTTNAGLSGFTLQGGATRSGAAGSSTEGGGLFAVSSNAFVFNCVFTNNFAEDGGGVAFATVNNSLIARNCAFNNGGGAYGANLNNCTVTRNYSTQPTGMEQWGDGIYGGLIRNSIVWENGGPYPVNATVDDWSSIVGFQFSELFQYSCTSRPQNVGSPTMFSAGVVTNDPRFLDGIHLATTSPCRGSANASFALGTDLNGQPWANPPSMGCFEVATNEFVGPLSLTILPTGTNVGISSPSTLYGLGFTAQVTGHASSFNWTFGDGAGFTNAGATVGHGWTNVGAYVVTCTAFNSDHPSGVTATVLIHVERLPQPYFHPVAITNGSVQITFETLVGASYFLQYATNLAPPVTWFPLQNFTPVLGGQEQFTDTPPTNQTRFYRILAQ